MKIRTKISLSLLLILSFLFIFSFLTYKETRDFHLMREKSIVSRNLLLAASNFKAQVRNYLLTTFEIALIKNTKEAKEKIISEKKLVEEKLIDFKEMTEKEYLMHKSLDNSSGTEGYQVEEVIKSYRVLERTLNAVLNLAAQGKNEELEAVLLATKEVNFVDFLNKITIIIDREGKEVEAERYRTEHSIVKLKRMATFFPLIAFGLSLAMIFGITKSVTTPLRKLEEAAQEIYTGNFDVPLLMVGTDEISNFSRTFNRMVVSLKNNRDSIEQQQQTIFESAKLASLGEMARGVAHEINSPLAAIILGAELIERKNSKLAEPNKDISKLATSIVDAGERIETIVKGLKGISRDANKDAEETFTIRHLINSTLDLCGEMFKANKVEVIVQESQIDKRIHGKETLLSQCLHNLITNSFEAIGPLEEKWIQIGAVIEDKQLEIRITDSGKGIAEEVRAKMFRPMYTTKPIGSGPGLGLSVARSIITNFGGSIVYDEKIEHTCFIIKLPYS